MDFKHILVTTDLSEVSSHSFARAVALAKACNAKISLLHVAEEFAVPYEVRRVVWDPTKLEEMEARYVNAVGEELNKMITKHFQGLEVNKHVEFTKESSARAICEFAKNQGCDLIVMTSNGRGFIGQLFLGSTVQKVLVETPCPVLVVRAEAKAS